MALDAFDPYSAEGVQKIEEAQDPQNQIPENTKQEDQTPEKTRTDYTEKRDKLIANKNEYNLEYEQNQTLENLEAYIKSLEALIEFFNLNRVFYQKTKDSNEKTIPELALELKKQKAICSTMRARNAIFPDGNQSNLPEKPPETWKSPLEMD